MKNRIASLRICNAVAVVGLSTLSLALPLFANVPPPPPPPPPPHHTENTTHNQIGLTYPSNKPMVGGLSEGFNKPVMSADDFSFDRENVFLEEANRKIEAAQAAVKQAEAEYQAKVAESNRHSKEAQRIDQEALDTYYNPAFHMAQIDYKIRSKKIEEAEAKLMEAYRRARDQHYSLPPAQRVGSNSDAAFDAYWAAVFAPLQKQREALERQYHPAGNPDWDGQAVYAWGYDQSGGTVQTVKQFDELHVGYDRSGYRAAYEAMHRQAVGEREKAYALSKDIDAAFQKIQRAKQALDDLSLTLLTAVNAMPNTPVPVMPLREGTGRISGVGGRRVEVQIAEGGWQTVTEGQEIPINYGVRVHTGFRAEVTLTLTGGRQLVIKPMSLVEIQTTGEPGNVRTLLHTGEVNAQVNRSTGAAGDFNVKTPTTTASVRGTKFSVSYNEKTKISRVTVTEHDVLVTPENPALQPVVVHEGYWVEVSPAAMSAVKPIDVK